MSSVRVLRVVVLAVAALLLGSCDSGGSVGTPTVAPSRSPGERPEVTATIPSPTRSPAREETTAASPEETQPTRTPARPGTTAPSPADTQPNPTRTVTRTETTAPDPTSAQPNPTRTETRTETVTPTQSQPASPTSPAVAPASSETSDTPSWLWWVLIAFLVALAVAIPLLVRSRHRRAWRDDLASAEQEVAWFARTLIPDLRQTGSVEAAAGGWAVAASRVSAAEDRLTVLEASAPDDAAQARAATLRDAVRSARGRLDALRESSSAATMSQDLDAVAADLESALTPPSPA